MVSLWTSPQLKVLVIVRRMQNLSCTFDTVVPLTGFNLLIPTPNSECQIRRQWGPFFRVFGITQLGLNVPVSGKTLYHSTTTTELVPMLPCKYLTSIGNSSYISTGSNAAFSFNQERTNEFSSLRVPPSVVACGPQPQLDWEEEKAGKCWFAPTCGLESQSHNPHSSFFATHCLCFLPTGSITPRSGTTTNVHQILCAWRGLAVALMKQVREKPYRAVIGTALRCYNCVLLFQQG